LKQRASVLVDGNLNNNLVHLGIIATSRALVAAAQNVVCFAPTTGILAAGSKDPMHQLGIGSDMLRMGHVIYADRLHEHRAEMIANAFEVDILTAEKHPTPGSIVTRAIDGFFAMIDRGHEPTPLQHVRMESLFLRNPERFNPETRPKMSLVVARAAGARTNMNIRA
jgi:hypothetical protein